MGACDKSPYFFRNIAFADWAFFVTLVLKSRSHGRIIKENDPQQARGRKHEREGVPGFFPILQKKKDGEVGCGKELCLQGNHGKTV
jgi:hypothetical protein